MLTNNTDVLIVGAGPTGTTLAIALQQAGVNHLLIDKLTPRFDDYSRGDIVVFHPPADWAQENAPDGTPFIKRVIGEPGDVVAIRDGEYVITVPELIAVLDIDTREPITTEARR